MKTGALKQIGAGRQRPKTHYLEKHYPIDGRTDFYKWVIATPNGRAKDFKGDIMYFDSFDFELAKTTLKAIKGTERLNKAWLES